MRSALWIFVPLFVLATTTGIGAAAEESLPFAMPVPEGWRTETIPFPLEFAPDLPYSGLEELRFAPGMFEEGSSEFWTYAFVWWVGSDEPVDVPALSRHLETYFRGLAAAVAESRGFEVGDATFGAALEADLDRGFSGTAETLDAFVTRGQVRLNIRGQVLECEARERQAVFFALSPREASHPVWSVLDAILDGFDCDPKPDGS